LFLEKNLEQAMEYLEKYNIFREIHPNINYTLEMKKSIEKIKHLEKTYIYFKVEKWKIVLFIILENLKEEELNLVFKKFDFSEKLISKYTYGISRGKNVLVELEKDTKNSEIYKTLKDLTSEIIILIYIQSRNDETKTKIHRYLYKLSKKKPIVDGKILLELGYKPGKQIKIDLENYFMKQLDLKDPTLEMILKR
jgi:tRNA nucleotidyltransferase (CCA-adding enzyme)